MAETSLPLARLVRFAISALGVSALALGAGCVTRTVYVVDDRDEPAMAAAPQAAPLATAPPRGMDLAGPDEFYEPLSPYGSWHAHPRYGHVFAPSSSIVGAGWRPYSRGHWEYTEWGWTWVSDLPFGWATFHYGNWFYDAGHGWVWAPGTRWAPAWVTWRTGGGYVGWAPMPPGAAYGASYSVYDTSWIFVSTGDFGAPLIYPVIVRGGYYRNCLVVTRPYRTTYVTYGSTYYRGPDPDYVRREGGRVVHRPISDVDNDRPTTRPPRGVRVSSASHNGHDGSVGGRSNRRGDGANDRGDGRGGDRGNGRGDGRGDGRDGDRVSDRGDGRDGHPGEGRGRDNANGRGSENGDRGNGRGSDRGDGHDDDNRLALPGERGGREVGADGRGGRADPRDGRGQGRDRDNGVLPPGRDRDVPASGDSRPPGNTGAVEVVTPTAPNGNGDGNRSGGRNDDGSDEDGVPADKRVVRPDSGEVRSPDDNPYAGNPSGGSNGFGAQSSGFGAQQAPSAAPGSRAAPPTTVRPSDPRPADSRFGRRLPSRFGAPDASTPAPNTRAPRVAPPASPGNGYGRTPPQRSPYQQQTRPSVAQPRTAPTQRYTAPAPHPAPAPRASQSQGERKQEKRKQQKRKQQKKKGDSKERKQSRSRR